MTWSTDVAEAPRRRAFTQLTAVDDGLLAGKELAQTEEIW